MLPVLINYKVIHHTLTYWEIILSMIIPKHIAHSTTCLKVETDDKHRYWQWQTQYCWERLLLCSSGCKQICGTQHWYVSWVSRKCQTRAGVSVDIYKTLECVTKTDSKFPNRALIWMTPKSTSINGVTIWLEQLDFCLNRCKRELTDQHFASWIVFLISLSSRQSAVMTCPR